MRKQPRLMLSVLMAEAMVFRAVATGVQYCRNQISFGQSSFFVLGTHHLALFYLI
jgi:hypothetical protein